MRNLMRAVPSKGADASERSGKARMQMLWRGSREAVRVRLPWRIAPSLPYVERIRRNVEERNCAPTT